MANINAPDIQYFESYSNEIVSKFQRVKQLVPHRGSSGEYHEEIIRNMLRNFLTKRYSIKQGFIYKSPTEVSNQIDIMVVDENSPAAYIFQEGNFAIVMPESVLAVIEVKTTLNAKDFEVATNNIASAKSLMEFPATLTGIVFSYQGATPNNNNLNTWFKKSGVTQYQSKLEVSPNLYLFLTGDCLLSRYTKEGKADYAGKYYHRLSRNKKNDQGWKLSVMLTTIISACELHETRLTHTFTTTKTNMLLQANEAEISQERFAFDEGLSQKALV